MKKPTKTTKKVEKKRIVSLIRSETWIDDNYDEINTILEEAIAEMVGDNQRIVNIEVKERGGLKRFWIYVEDLPTH